MRNYLYLLGAGIGLLFLIGLGTCKSNANPLIDQVFEPSVRLGDFCSGEIIKSERDEKTGEVSTFILTAKHCVLKTKDSDTIEINKDQYDSKNRKVGKKVYLSQVYGRSYKSDLALLKLRDKDTFFEHVAEVAKSDIKLEFGQDVDLIGYPLGRSMTYTTGKLGFVEDGVFGDISRTTQFYRATPDLAPGSSGSSMFTFVDGSYKVIGIATGGAQMFSWFNFFTPIEEINEYLDTALPKKDKKTDEVRTR